MSVTIVNDKYAQRWETTPKSIPQAGEDVIVGDVHVLEIHLINKTSSAATVTITDKQGTPVNLIPPALTLQPLSDNCWEFTGRYAPGGVHWAASVDNAIEGFIAGRI